MVASVAMIGLLNLRSSPHFIIWILHRERSSEVSLPELPRISQCPHEFRIGFRKRGARDCGEDREVERHTMEINHQCRHLLKGEGKTRFFVKRNLSRDDTKKTLKTVSEGEMKVNTDEYSIYEG